MKYEKGLKMPKVKEPKIRVPKVQKIRGMEFPKLPRVFGAKKK